MIKLALFLLTCGEITAKVSLARIPSKECWIRGGRYEIEEREISSVLIGEREMEDGGVREKDRGRRK